MQRKIEAIVKVAYPSLCTRKGGRRAQTQEVPYEEARREAIRQASRKYYNTHREAIFARRAKATKRKRAAMKAVRKETSPGT